MLCWQWSSLWNITPTNTISFPLEELRQWISHFGCHSDTIIVISDVYSLFGLWGKKSKRYILGSCMAIGLLWWLPFLEVKWNFIFLAVFWGSTDAFWRKICESNSRNAEYFSKYYFYPSRMREGTIFLKLFSSAYENQSICFKLWFGCRRGSK